MSSKVDTKNNFQTTHNGEVYGCGAEGAVTGKGAGKKRDKFGGALLIDDPMKANDCNSKVKRESLAFWVQNVLLTRLNMPVKTPIILIMQRLHDRDLAGYLLPNQDHPEGLFNMKADLLKLPAILTLRQLDELGFPKGCYSRYYGDPAKDEYPLWHGHFPLDRLRKMRGDLDVDYTVNV